MGKIKNILLSVDLEGNGIVNYDSSDQKKMYLNTNLQNTMYVYYDNVAYAKKVFTETDGILSYKIKISHDCLMHGMYVEKYISKVPKITVHDALFYSFIASPEAITTGYLNANTAETQKKKGAITLLDAVQTCNAKSYLDQGGRSGSKVSKDDSTDKADNSIFKRESVGDIKYSTKGNIDLMSLQFISCDQTYDRFAFNPDKFNMFKNFLVKRMPTFNSELGYYLIKDTTVKLPEYGILFSNDDVLFMVKDFLKKLLSLYIKRRNGDVRVSSLKIKLVEDVIEDTYEKGKAWITISSMKDIEALNFETDFFYEQFDAVQAEELRKEVDRLKEEVEAKEKAETLAKNERNKIKNAQKKEEKEKKIKENNQ